MKKELDKLNLELEKISISKYGKLPIYDGIVDLEVFQNSKLKILWILKEVNSLDDEGGWDMREAIKDLKTKTGIKKGWEKTFTSIVYVTDGLLNNNNWEDIPYLYDNPDTIDILKNIAYINIKKISGGARTKIIELNDAYFNYRELLIKQINIINPDIIIFGGTYLYFKNDIQNSDLKKFGSCNVFKIKNKIYVDAYHPQYVGINREKYFTDILTGVKSVM